MIPATEALVLDRLEGYQNLIQMLSNRLDWVIHNREICCGYSGSSSDSSGSSFSSSSSSHDSCVYFQVVAHISGTDPVVAGNLEYDIYGQYDTSIPVNTPNGTFPWPVGLEAGRIGFAAFEPASAGPVNGIPSYELLYHNGRWRVYAAHNTLHGNSTTEVGVSPPMAYTKEPPLGVMTMAFISGYNLTVTVTHQYCPPATLSSSSSSSAPPCGDCEDVTEINMEVTGTSIFMIDDVVNFAPTDSPFPPGMYDDQCFYSADVTWKSPYGTDGPTCYFMMPKPGATSVVNQWQVFGFISGVPFQVVSDEIDPFCFNEITGSYPGQGGDTATYSFNFVEGAKVCNCEDIATVNVEVTGSSIHFEDTGLTFTPDTNPAPETLPSDGCYFSTTPEWKTEEDGSFTGKLYFGILKNAGQWFMFGFKDSALAAILYGPITSDDCISDVIRGPYHLDENDPASYTVSFDHA